MVSNIDVIKKMVKDALTKTKNIIKFSYTFQTYYLNSSKTNEKPVDIIIPTLMVTMGTGFVNILPYMFINPPNPNNEYNNPYFLYSTLVGAFLPILTNGASMIYEQFKQEKKDMSNQKYSSTRYEDSNWEEALKEVEKLTNSDNTNNINESDISLEERIKTQHKLKTL